jgi:RNA polymerase sigma-70 factor (ECF subfamily)
MDINEENDLFEKINESNVEAFETLFHTYYGYLCLYATKILKNDAAAEEIVQDFFVKLWEKRLTLTIETSINNYLFRSIKNLCLNYIQHNKVKIKHAQTSISENNLSETFDDNYFEIDLAEKIETGILSLPKKRREIFRLSRENGLKYREIAQKLNISIKTVEAQMGLAIKTLREHLKDYNTFFTLFLCFFKK